MDYPARILLDGVGFRASHKKAGVPSLLSTYHTWIPPYRTTLDSWPNARRTVNHPGRSGTSIKLLTFAGPTGPTRPHNKCTMFKPRHPARKAKSKRSQATAAMNDKQQLEAVKNSHPFNQGVCSYDGVPLSRPESHPPALRPVKHQHAQNHDDHQKDQQHPSPALLCSLGAGHKRLLTS